MVDGWTFRPKIRCYVNNSVEYMWKSVIKKTYIQKVTNTSKDHMLHEDEVHGRTGMWVEKLELEFTIEIVCAY